MSLTGSQLLTGFSRFIGDYWGSTTTSAGAAGGTTLIDTQLARFGNDTLIDYYFIVSNEVRVANDSTEATGSITLAPGFSSQVGNSTAYTMHKFDPVTKVDAINSAILSLSDVLPRVLFNETITLDGRNTEYTIPSTIRKGPVVVLVEDPIEIEPQWNFVQDPRGDSTSNWTASSATASTVTSTSSDLLIPKYDDTCTKIAVAASTNGTYTQSVASMTNGITAALSAGRAMVFGAWVYCTTASRVTLTLEDDTAESSSAAHQGLGWELLTVQRDIDPTNATTLKVGFDVSNAAAAVTFFWNRAWFMFGEDLPTHYPDHLRHVVTRDGSNQKLWLPRTTGKRNVRILGSAPLTTLSTTFATAMSDTVEVDANSAELLYAKAAQILFGRELLNAPDSAILSTRVRVAEARLPELQRQWRHEMGARPMLVGPYD